MASQSPEPPNLLPAPDRMQGHGWKAMGGAQAAPVARRGPFGESAVMYHRLGVRTTEAAPFVFGCYVPGGLTPGALYMITAWVLVPQGFAGTRASIYGVGYGTASDRPLFVARCEAWQQVWACIRLPAGAADMFCALAVLGPAGCELYSAGWSLELLVPPVLRVAATAGLAALGLDGVELAPAVTQAVPAAMVFGNHMQTAAVVLAQGYRDRIYAARRAALTAILLFRLPAGSLLFGGEDGVVLCGETLLQDQVPPEAAQSGALTPADRPVLDVAAEALLVMRYGISTWGHFLCELLPRLLLAEQRFPGRFRYVLPVQVFEDLGTHVWNSIHQALAACGIGAKRILVILSQANYRFAALHAVSPVWSDFLLHPAAGAALRAAFAAVPAGSARRLAVLRDPRGGRVLENAPEINALLQAAGFLLCETGRLSLVAQVSLFKGADVVFGVLGSDLANLVFAPEGVQVISAAPDLFGDRFFYALVLERGGTMMDLRGPVTGAAELGHKARFRIDPAVLTAALARLG